MLLVTSVGQAWYHLVSAPGHPRWDVWRQFQTVGCRTDLRGALHEAIAGGWCRLRVASVPARENTLLSAQRPRTAMPCAIP